jgi:hypothetical protein
MPKCSAFTPYGLLRYSSKPSTLQRIYESTVTQTGAAYASDGAFAADVYAMAREVACVQGTISRVGNHRNPNKASELLPELEHDYGLRPHPNATLKQRRDALADKMSLKFGARRQAIVDGLTTILGTALVAYRTLEPIEVTASPTTPYTLPGHNVFLEPGNTVKLYRLESTVSLWGLQAVTLTYVAGDQSPLRVGELLVFEVGRLGLEETLLVAATSGSIVTCDFNTAHGAGCYVRGGTWPRWTSPKRWNIVVVTDDAFANAPLMAEVHTFLEGALRGVSTWTVTVETSPGYVGPFVPGAGLPGVTPIPEIEI